MICSKRRLSTAGLAIAIAYSFAGCGGGGSSHNASAASGSNVQAITVSAGPNGNYANGVFTSVNVCAPGSSNCQTINNVLVDTGSFGLRVLSSALTVSLPQQTDTNGNSIVECAQFVMSVMWGPVKNASVAIGAEQAGSIPIEVIGDPAFAAVPASCSSHGKPQQDLKHLGANGILGIGQFVEDCGGACAFSSGNPGVYYACAASSCHVTTEPTASQVKNPVASFAGDNNGVLVQLPAVSGVQQTATGSLIFGIGTESNNGLGSAKVFTVDNFGNITTTFKGNNHSSFIDSGSNAYFFLTSSATGIPLCPAPEKFFYCPSSSDNLSATIAGANGNSSTVNFTIANADTLFANSGVAVFPDLGGPNAGTFDWGLPFFYGRNVFVAIEGKTTPGGIGPFWAF